MSWWRDIIRQSIFLCFLLFQFPLGPIRFIMVQVQPLLLLAMLFYRWGFPLRIYLDRKPYSVDRNTPFRGMLLWVCGLS